MLPYITFSSFLLIKTTIFCRLCRYFRFCIKRILDRLVKAEFTANLEKSSRSEASTEKYRNGNNGSNKDIQKNEMKKPQSRRPVNESLQGKKDIAKDYMVINNRNWGKMSAMMLAAETRDRSIIAHDLCWKVIGKVWRNGAVRHQVCQYGI